jgi:hypothetical protein
MIVTDIKRVTKDGGFKRGFYLDGYLAENFSKVSGFLKKGWDVLGIVSGHGNVRTGKSTMALQSGIFIAWLLAGGEMCLDRKDKANFGKVIKSPTKDLNFTLDNVVFTPEELMQKAKELPRNSVIIYDEGRAGLDSKSVMSKMNKIMEDFFQECGVFGHVILLVLPNFFKLHEDYATARSIFLIDVYHNTKFDRGFFNFYNKLRKEQLFFFGKRKIGITAKYSVTRPNFYGRFTSFLPFSKKEYEDKKKKALADKTIKKKDAKMILQRDAAIYLYKKFSKKPERIVAEEMGELLDIEMGRDLIQDAISRMLKLDKREEKVDERELLKKLQEKIE